MYICTLDWLLYWIEQNTRHVKPKSELLAWIERIPLALFYHESCDNGEATVGTRKSGTVFGLSGLRQSRQPPGRREDMRGVLHQVLLTPHQPRCEYEGRNKGMYY